MARVLIVRDHRIEFNAVLPSINPLDLPTDFNDHFGLFPAQVEPRPPSQSPALPPTTSTRRPPAGRRSAGRRVGVRRRVIRQVVVLEVGGSFSEVAEDLDRAIELALADGPRGVVCDLSDLSDLSDRSDPADAAADLDPAAVEMLASAGRHVRDWSAVPVVVACPDERVRTALVAHPLGRNLIVTPSLLTAVSAVLATPAPAVEWLRLAPHPTAPRASREFVTQTLQDWGLDSLILSVSLVVSELVSSSAIHSGTDIDLSVAWNQGALRLTVRDHSPAVVPQPYGYFDLYRRGVTVVAGLSRSFGALPTTEGGKVVWAVLNAARPRRSTAGIHPVPASASTEPPRFTSV